MKLPSKKGSEKAAHGKSGGYNRIGRRFSAALSNSAVGRYLSGYDEANEKLKASRLTNGIDRIKARVTGEIEEPVAEVLPEEAEGVVLYESETIHRGIRSRLSALFDESRFFKGAGSLKAMLLNTPLSTYGLILISFAFLLMLAEGLVMLFTVFRIPLGIFSYVTEADTVLTVTYMTAALVLMTLALVLLFAQGGSLHDYMLSSAFFGPFVHGRAEDGYTVQSISTIKKKYAVLIGTLLGFAAFFITPYRFFVLILSLLAVFVILNMPEIGVIGGLLLLPYLSLFPHPTVFSFVLSLLVIGSTLIKLLRGKRTYRLELLDIWVGLFLVLMLFGGMVTIGGLSSFYAGLCALVLGGFYFPVAVLIRDKVWLKRALTAVTVSALPVAILAILEFVLDKASDRWHDTAVFSSLSGRAASLWGNPNVLAEFLLIAFFVTFGLMLSSEKKSGRFFLFLALLLDLAALVLTFSRGAWLAFAITLTVLLIMRSRKTLPFILLAIIVFSVLCFVLPESFTERLASIVTLSDSSTIYRLNIWKGCSALIRQCFLTGVGVGTSAFEEAYRNFALSGIESAPHAHNLIMQMMIELGIVGVAVFAILLITLLRVAVTLFSKCRIRHEMSLASLGILGAVMALLLQGLTDYIWYNPRMFMLFFVLFALLRSARVIGERSMIDPIREPDGCDMDYLLR